MRLDRYIGEHTGKYSIIENRKGGRVVNIGDPEDDFFRVKTEGSQRPGRAPRLRRFSGGCGP